MFKLRKNRIESDEGFTIEFDHSRFTYTSGSRTLKLNHEMLPAPRSVAVWRDSIRSLNSQHEMSVDESQAILDNIGRAFRSVGYELTVI